MGALTHMTEPPEQGIREDDVWTDVIVPYRGWFDLKLRDIWRYRDLVYLFVYRDFVAQYKQTILGPIWHLIQPLLTTFMFTIVFGRIAKIPTDGLPPFLFYMSGTVLWSYFSLVTIRISDTFIANAGIFGKVYFPRLAIPISVLISQLIGFAIQALMLVVLVGWFFVKGADLAPNRWLWLTPVLILMLAGLGLGLGIIVSSLTTRYRDLKVVVGFGMQLAMYATPIVYPMSVLSEDGRRWMALNPIAPIVETFRYALLGQGTVEVSWLLTSAVTIFLLLVVGIVMFNRIERTFMDTV